MKVILPVIYLDRLETDGLGLQTGELIERDVPEISSCDAPVIVSARSSFTMEDHIRWRSIDLRLHKGKILRSANYFADSQHCIGTDALPARVRGKVDWKYGEFIQLLPGSRDRYLHNAAVSLQNGNSGFIRIRAALDDDLMIEWAQARMREMTQRALDRLVIVDGQVWKETNWPRIRLAGERSLMAQLTFDEENESVRPHYGRLAYDHRMLLLSQAHKIRQLAEEAGIPLDDDHRVEVDRIDTGAMPFLSERLNEAWRIADTVERRVSSIVGEQSDEAVASWLALRDALSRRDPEAEVEDVVELVMAMKNVLGREHADIVAETKRMLSVLDIEEAPGRRTKGPGYR
ncbi:hypothetical protein [Rhizobium sp. BK176]|uniref:hypothetical protein n=1 Tax=Rhizobium sp. BK176 TaxID=2587071 RepID=UPI002167BA71|nr:hypothetical protein [Rhizobium sp. BK176]MCS4089579.1 hypothetical protein [Rhizobium sp. BK176]